MLELGPPQWTRFTVLLIAEMNKGRGQSDKVVEDWAKIQIAAILDEVRGNRSKEAYATVEDQRRIIENTCRWAIEKLQPPPCGTCGSTIIIHTGKCYKCINCGDTSEISLV